MVRHKVRWMIVRLDFEEHVRGGGDNRHQRQQSIATFPTKQEVYSTFRNNLVQCFGIVAEGAAMDVQGKKLLCEMNHLLMYVLLMQYIPYP
jgi:hypothetical protein